MSLPKDLEQAVKALPLFPLRGVVLFPGELLPLHVFEPRYLALIRDVLATHGSLSVVHVTDREGDMGGRPAIAAVAGIGTIVSHGELPGGRFNIVLRGRGRVRLQELSFLPPYRRALATMLTPTREDVPAVEVAAMHASARAFAGFVRERDPTFELRLPKDATAGELADSIAARLLLDASDRQTALEQLDARKRVHHVTEVLTVQRVMLEPREGGLN